MRTQNQYVLDLVIKDFVSITHTQINVCRCTAVQVMYEFLPNPVLSIFSRKFSVVSKIFGFVATTRGTEVPMNLQLGENVQISLSSDYHF